MTTPFHKSRLCQYRVRAARAIGKLPVLTFDEADELYGKLCACSAHSKRDESARRVDYLADALYDQYLRPAHAVRERHATLEFRDDTWYRWTIVNDIPVEFRKLNPQPEAPNR